MIKITSITPTAIPTHSAMLAPPDLSAAEATEAAVDVGVGVGVRADVISGVTVGVGVGVDAPLAACSVAPDITANMVK